MAVTQLELINESLFRFNPLISNLPHITYSRDGENFILSDHLLYSDDFALIIYCHILECKG